MAEKPPPTRVSLQPLLWLAFSFAAGITAQYYFSISLQIVGVIGILAVVTAIVLRGSVFATSVVCVAFFWAGFTSACLEQAGVRPDRVKLIYDKGLIASGDPVEVEGIVRGGTEASFGGAFLQLDVRSLYSSGQSLVASGTVRVFVSTASAAGAEELARLKIKHGSRIRVACRLEREDRFLNPGVMLRREALDQQGTDAVASVKSPLLIEKLADGASLLRPLFELRSSLITDFRRSFSGGTGGVLIASLLGDKNFLDKQTADIFREGGTFHILVISGLHVTFIGGVVLLLVEAFTRRRIWQFLVPLIFLWAYTLAVGADVPVVRASVMFTVLLFSRFIYRRGNLLNSLGACTLLLLVWRPHDLFNPSFLLTFISVAAIVAGAFPLIEKLRAIGSWMPTAETPFPPNAPFWLRRFCETLYWNEKAWEIEVGKQIWSARLFKSPLMRVKAGLRKTLVYMFEGLLVSLVVQFWLLPLLVCYFHRVSPASVVLNLWSGFLIAFESFAAVGAMLLSHIADWLAIPLVEITQLFDTILLWLPQLFIENGWASFRVPVYPGIMGAIYLVYFVPVAGGAFLLHRWDPYHISAGKNRPNLLRPLIVTLFLASLIIFHPRSSPTPNGRLTVDFLDVGQGDSALITFPDGKTMLVDGGGRQNFDDDGESVELDVPRIGEAVVSEFLWEKGYSQVDYLVATHADSDHMQGLADVAANFSIKEAFFGRMPAGDPDFDELSRVLQGKGVRSSLISVGDSFEIGGVRVDVLNPRNDSQVSDNDHSVVLHLTFGRRSFLFTGDIESPAETDLVAGNTQLKANVIKVAHHGSRTSSTEMFIKAVSAELAIISVGRHSRFGHPHPEVVERWKDSGAEVRKTGERGTVTVSTDGADLDWKTYLEQP